MKGIAMSLPNDDHVRNILIKSEFNHAKNALAHIESGQYEGEHWLASFAVYFLSAN